MAIYMLDAQFATQGPAPDYFHVPLNTEWQAVYDVWIALGGGSSDGTNFGIALKLPFAGNRSDSNSNVYNQGSFGLYWSSSRSNTNRAYGLFSRSTALNPQYANVRTIGFSVRCFKNSPVIPTSSWTKLYGTSIESGGIFWSSTDGLISLSSDGTTWITIMDKNLGATTVWNNGDTLSQANCGNYYQRGNNYGFPRTGGVTTSSTQVDASNYGPGNYYNSSTFITGLNDWSSVQNDNLWGGEDGNVPVQNEPKKIYKGSTEIKAVYLGTTKVRPSGPDKDYLCFTAEEANSTVKLSKSGSPTSVTLETSTDGRTWTDYTFGTDITLTKIGDKVYWRNKSETPTGFSTSTSNYYRFSLSGTIGASGDINFLLSKNSTDTIEGNRCYYGLFYSQIALTKCPKLTATTLKNYCYASMFYGCLNLETIPNLPAVTMQSNCYSSMFSACQKIKLSSTQTGDYQTPYRIPTTGTGTTATSWNNGMLSGTGGTFTGNPTINTTYYTSNTVV